MGWVLAIDFGTSVTAAATIEVGLGVARPVAVEVGSSWRVPSGVLRLDRGQLLVGVMAERQAAMRIEAFEATPKRRMGEGVMDLGGEVRVTDAIAAVLREVADEAVRSRGGTRPEAVCLTHPASWAGSRLAGLGEAARTAGLNNVVLLAEPVAAACWYAATSGKVPAGGRVAVYDLGGGTFDVAVVESIGDGTFVTVGRPAGIDPLGGVDFDFALLDVIGQTISSRDPQLWASLDRPADSAARRRRRTLLTEVRTLKEDLSKVVQSSLVVPETQPPMEITVTRKELNAVIAAQIQRSATVLEQTISSAGSTPRDLAAVYLVGGSSRIPLVEEIIAKRLGVTPATLDEPKQVVAYGAATHLARRWTPVPSPVPVPRPQPHTAWHPPSPPRQPQTAWYPPTSPPKKSNANLIVAALMAAVLILGGVILTVFLVNRDPEPTTRADPASGDSGGTDPGSGDNGGSDPGSGDSGGSIPPAEPPGDLSGYGALDLLAQNCYAGDMAACDSLLESNSQGYIDYGFYCGGRQTQPYPDGEFRYCTVFEQDLAAANMPLPNGVPPDNLAGDGHERLDQLAERCYGGDMASCDDLYRSAAANSAYANYGNTCGRRIAAADVRARLCTDIFG